MTWVRYDDNVGRHPKVRALDDATYRLWREAIEWCSQNLTDGVVLAHELGLTSIRASGPRARKLVESGLWHAAGAACDSKNCPPSGVDGWVVHDYWDYQRKREDILAERKANRERQRKWMEKARAGKKGSNGSPNGVSDGVPNGSPNGNPAPPRPAPKEAGAGTLPTSPPAAVGGVAPAGGEGSKTPGRRCPTCGNPTTSAYHRGSCRAETTAISPETGEIRSVVVRPTPDPQPATERHSER